MQTDLITVSKLFTERIFRIPDYQRGYAWTEKQLKDYWVDLMQLDVDKNHYLGVLTLEDVPKDIVTNWEEDQWIIKSKKYEPFYVVDGQQRLTTTIILIQSIVEHIDDSCKLNYTSISDIKKKYLWDTKDDGVSRSYIFGYEKDNPSYEFLKTKIFLEQSDNHFPPQETIYTYNLEKAKLFFLEKIANYRIEDIETLFIKITQQLLFNIYAISREIDVFVAFETMNNRGKPLSHLELLKNRLIYLSTRFDVADYEKRTIRSTINECWKSVYHYLGKNKENPLDDDMFLKHHYLLYFAHKIYPLESEYPMFTRVSRFYAREYKDNLLEEHFTVKNIDCQDESSKKINVSDIYEYAKSLKLCVEDWYKILNPFDSDFSNDEILWLDRLNRLGIWGVAPLLMIYFQKTKVISERISLLKCVERLIFFSELLRYKQLVDFIGELRFLGIALNLAADKISHEKVLKELSEWETILNSKESWRNIRKNFGKRGFYDWRTLKYFLYEYNSSIMENSKTLREKIDWNIYNESSSDYYSIEHIYPQHPRKSCWVSLYASYNESERSKLRHSLGNLVPLSQRKNSSFSNKCFYDKLGTDENRVGFRYGSYAENEIAISREWKASDILNRGLKLLEFMEQRWDLQIGDKLKKVQMLGLEFMIHKDRRSN